MNRLSGRADAWRRLLAAVSALGVGVVLSLVEVRTPAGFVGARLALATSTCPNVVFYSARGSGETAKTAGGLLGGPGSVIWSRLHSQLSARSISSSAAPIYGISGTTTTYTAASVSVLYPTSAELVGLAGGPGAKAAAMAYYMHHNYLKYNSSITSGTSVTVYDLESEARRCPHTQVVVSGYSQGAIAVHDAENYLKAHDAWALKNVVATLLIGDGDKVANSKAVRFGSAPLAGEGLRSYFHALDRVPRTDVASPSATAEIQNQRDIVGDFTMWDLFHWKTSGTVHTTYNTTSTNIAMLKSAANWAAKKVDANHSLAPTITTSSLPDATVGVAYSQTLRTADNHSGTWSWLPPYVPPPWLNLNPGTGELTGTPGTSAAGTQTLEVKFADVNGQFASGAVRLAVNPQTGSPNNPGSCPTTSALGQWTTVTGCPPLPPSDAIAGGLVQFENVSCSGTMCAVTGLYKGSAGNNQVALWTWTSATGWAAAKAPMPSDETSNDPMARVDSLTCAPGVCVASGGYETTSGSNPSILWTWTPLSGWSVARPPVPASDEYADSLYPASCGDAVCVVSGSYQADGGGPRSTTWMWSSATGWHATALTLPPDAASTQVGTFYGYGYKCGAHICAAMGLYTDALGNDQVALWTWDGTQWNVAKAALPPDASSVNQSGNPGGMLACGDQTCVVAGSYYDTAHHMRGAFQTWSGSEWVTTEAPWPSDSSATPNMYPETLACGSAICVAGGYLTDGSSLFGHVAWYWSATSGWALAAPPIPSDAGPAPTPQFVQSACSGGMCAVTGTYANASGGRSWIFWNWENGAWSSQVVNQSDLPPDASTGQTPNLSPPVCGSICAIGNKYTTTAGTQMLMAWAWNSTSGWNSSPMPAPAASIKSEDWPNDAFTCGDGACLFLGSWQSPDSAWHSALWMLQAPF